MKSLRTLKNKKRSRSKYHVIHVSRRSKISREQQRSWQSGLLKPRLKFWREWSKKILKRTTCRMNRKRSPPRETRVKLQKKNNQGVVPSQSSRKRKRPRTQAPKTVWSQDPPKPRKKPRKVWRWQRKRTKVSRPIPWFLPKLSLWRREEREIGIETKHETYLHFELSSSVKLNYFKQPI